jgi:hypothetical protein
LRKDVLWGAFSGLGQFIIGQLYVEGETDGGMEGWMDGGRGEERRGRGIKEFVWCT